jgi:hypothetical protein
MKNKEGEELFEHASDVYKIFVDIKTLGKQDFTVTKKRKGYYGPKDHEPSESTIRRRRRNKLLQAK